MCDRGCAFVPKLLLQKISHGFDRQYPRRLDRGGCGLAAAVNIRTVSKAVFTDAAAMLPTPSLIMMIASIEKPPTTPQAKPTI